MLIFGFVQNPERQRFIRLRDLARSPREKARLLKFPLAARDLLLRDNLTHTHPSFCSPNATAPSLLVQFRRQNMETLLANCVEKNLTQFMFSNAIFLCERLLAQFPSEVSNPSLSIFQFQFLLWLIFFFLTRDHLSDPIFYLRLFLFVCFNSFSGLEIFEFWALFTNITSIGYYLCLWMWWW